MCARGEAPDGGLLGAVSTGMMVAAKQVVQSDEAQQSANLPDGSFTALFTRRQLIVLQYGYVSQPLVLLILFKDPAKETLLGLCMVLGPEMPCLLVESCHHPLGIDRYLLGTASQALHWTHWSDGHRRGQTVYRACAWPS